MQIHLDPVGGVAGDMFIAAVTDAFPHLREGMLAAVRTAGLPAEVVCRFEPHKDHALTGSRFVVDLPPAPQGAVTYEPRSADPGHDHGDGHHHHHHDGHHHHHDDQPHGVAHAHPHANFAELRTALLASSLDAEVKHHAIGIFTVLASAEGKIHGHPVDEVSFHELGEWDSIADIVGAAYLIAQLDARAWTVGVLPLGSGFVQTAHGRLPVPVPATTAILEGFAFADDGLTGERITPTGAAILRHLNCRQQKSAGRSLKLKHSGYGFGTRRFPGLSNVLRVLAFEAAEVEGDLENSEAVVVEFDVDDQTPEDLAIGLDRIRARAGVLDVIQMPVFGKKGRITARIQVLAEPDALSGVVETCFLETTTIGLRYHTVNRHRLPRELRVVQVGNHAIRVKVAHRPDTVTAKAESDDMAQTPGSNLRSRMRFAAEEAGLGTTEGESS
jgi:uncharacterized protein (TIGR00299 family) protein